MVKPKYTSQTCPIESCKHQDKKNRMTQSRFKCLKCGYVDIVSALNTLAAIVILEIER